MKRLILFLTICFTCIAPALADSPITSTPIYTAYTDIPLVAKAAKENAVLDDEMLAFLANAQMPIDQKVALCSALGWGMKGKAKKFTDYLKKQRGWTNADAKNMSADEMLCLSYLMALDDYFNVDLSLELASKALAKNKSSYTFNMIFALIKAQKQFDSNWCKVFLTVAAVERNKALKQDLRNKAVDIIFDYINLYQDSCKGAKAAKNSIIPMRG
jgi:hypothetical protein